MVGGVIECATRKKEVQHGKKVDEQPQGTLHCKYMLSQSPGMVRERKGDGGCMDDRTSASSNLLQLYQLDPCGSHGPVQIQQNSYRHDFSGQCMWLHPPFFSIVTLHLGHSLVFEEIQLAVSLSSAHFFFHPLNIPQSTGRCTGSEHPKQNG
jgi:hypothetical protein